jgi:hypothetical protein
MNRLNEPTGKALGLPETKEDQVCEGNTDSLKLVSSDSEAISPAISHAAANGRELLKTETNASKSCNKSGSESSTKPNCYECKHRGSVAYSAHSSCNHPIFSAVPGGEFLPLAWMLKGLKSPFEKRLNLSYSQRGFKNGWFFWPMDFDPVWLETCDGFERNGKERRDDGCNY